MRLTDPRIPVLLLGSVMLVAGILKHEKLLIGGGLGLAVGSFVGYLIFRYEQRRKRSRASTTGRAI